MPGRAKRTLQVMAGAEHGGAEMACVDFCATLVREGYEVGAVTRPNTIRDPLLRDAGVQIYHLPFGGFADIYTPWALSRIVQKFQPRIVQSWMSRAAQKIRRWRPGMNCPPYTTISRLGGYYKLKHFPQTDVFTTITPDIKDHLIKSGVAPERIRHINNFAETETPERPASRAEMDTPEDAFVFLSLSRLHRAKALDTLLQALADARDKQMMLWIAGEGPERAALEALSADLGLSRQVRFLGWRTDRAALLQAADACVFPSRYEPFGTVFVQAWAQQCPLIVSAADGPRQFVKDGEDGLMFPIDDVTRLTAQMIALKADPSLRAALVKAGQARYTAEFTRDVCIGQYIDLYNELTAHLKT